MAYSYNVYTGNGSTTQFTIGFSYIRREHVKVYVNYVDTAYTYVNNTTVQLATAPGAGVRVEVRRVTPFANVLVDFTDGSTLVAADLDTSNLQHLYLEQELDDANKQAIYVDPASGQLTAGGQQIKNVADPTAAQDAATKAYVDTADALRLKRDGTQAMTGALPMGGFKVTGAADPTSAQDLATKTYVDTTTVASAGDTMTGNLAMGGNKVTGLGTPTANADAATKSYVDTVALAALPDGDRGDITVSGVGTVWTIDNGAVVEAKIGTGAVTETKLGTGAVTETKIGTGAVTSAKILDGTIVNADVNASAGITAGKLSFTQAGTGAVARTVDSRLKDVVSVKDFGAVGDGTTNDTAAIQTAINSGAKVINLSNATYRIVSTLTLSSADQTIVGGTLKFDGDNTQRIASITANNIAFKQVVFSGNNKQPKSALVWVNDNCVNPQFIDCEFKNITSVNYGVSNLNGSYGLLISPYGVTGFSVANCKFKDIVKYNDGVNTLPVVAATEGIGFVGGICFLPESLNPGATAQTVITEGFVSNCTFDNIRTILAAGLSLNDQAIYDDGDAIRTYGDTNAPSLNVTVSDCTFKSISKRVFKFRAKGSSAFDNTCYASGMPYAMVVAIDCISGITIKGFNFYTTSAKPVGSGVQWKNASADATPVLLEGLYFSHVNTAVELFSGHASTLQNFTLRNSVFDYIAVAAVLSTSPIAIDYANIVFDACRFTGGTNTANGLTFFGGSSSGNAGVEVSGCILTNLNVNCAGNNVRFNNNKVIIKSSSWTGAAPSTKLVRFGGAGSSNYDIDNLTIDASGLSTSYIGVNAEAFFLQGSGFRLKNISLVVPQGATQNYPHININSTNTFVNGFVYDGSGLNFVGVDVASQNVVIMNSIRTATGGTTTTRPFWYINNGSTSDIIFQNTTDLRDPDGSTPSIEIITGSNIGIFNLVSKATPTEVATTGGIVATFGCSQISIPTQSYTLSNITASRSIDASTITTSALASVVGTLLNDLKTRQVTR